MTYLPFYILIASACAWIYLAFFHHRFWRSNITLPKTSGRVEQWPQVAAVIPARNEEEVLSKTLPGVAAQDYPGRFDIIVVNDNSLDRTREVAAAVKGVNVLDAEPLIPGWAGKLWAMNQGVSLAQRKFPKAGYIWFTDADISHDKTVLKDLVEAAVLDKRNMISQMVFLHCRSFWEKALVPAFIFFFEMLYPFAAVNSDKSRISGAAGGCILLETRWLRKIGGLERIKTALIDDCEMARAVKSKGGRIWLGFGYKSRSIRSYTFEDFWATVARTAFTQLRNSTLLLIATVIALGVVFLAPPLLGIWGLAVGEFWAARTGIIVWGIMIVCYAPTLLLYKLHPIRGYALPFVAFLYSAMTVHSAIRHWRGHGGKWKKRSYDFRE